MKSNLYRSSVGVIILAAGKGKRMNAKKQNKVTFSLADKPIISHIVEFMYSLSVQTIVIVVGHAKESVIKVLKEYKVFYAEQKKRLGTGHAVACALKKLPPEISDVIVVYGDDAVLYTEKQLPIIRQLIEKHHASKSNVTFLTIEKENPFGLGRIVRDSKDNLLSIVEEKDASEAQKKITEINPGCFVFGVQFLKKYLPLIKKSDVTGEYYLTSLIDLALRDKEKISTIRGGKLLWRGVNTPSELIEAEKIFLSVK